MPTITRSIITGNDRAGVVNQESGIVKSYFTISHNSTLNRIADGVPEHRMVPRRTEHRRREHVRPARAVAGDRGTERADPGDEFIERAERIAESLKIAMFFRLDRAVTPAR